MEVVRGFSIRLLDGGNYVVEGNGIYQDIDFIKGGYINTLDKAITIREALIEDLKRDPIINPATLDERIDKLELINLEIDGKITDIQLAMAELVEINLGGM